MKEKLMNKEDYLKEVGDLIVAKILFGKKDSDLVAWVESIPRGKFSSIVKDAILAYINNDTNYRIPVFNLKKNVKPTVAKSLSIGKGDYEIYAYLYSIDKYLRSSKIKEILRHYIHNDISKLSVNNNILKIEKQDSTPAPKHAPNSEQKDSRAKRNQNKLLKFSQLMNDGKY
ncbi:hypothetical protein [Desulfolucanica intricata]|uniref:hypothetical protein n=1 Tax=Desulfolucanica intricata TaxID=1285191 RepID=UPI0008351459|nr:hypothetical protein [Desulfolucanica intricata]